MRSEDGAARMVARSLKAVLSVEGLGYIAGRKSAGFGKLV